MSNNNEEGIHPMIEETQKSYDDRVRLGHLEREMGGLKGEVGALKVAMTDNSAKLTGMQEQMHTISRSMEKVADRVHQPTAVNWGWIISGLMGILLIAGGYTSIVMEPLRTAAERNYELALDAQKDNHMIDRRLSYQEGFVAGGQAN